MNNVKTKKFDFIGFFKFLYQPDEIQEEYEDIDKMNIKDTTVVSKEVLNELKASNSKRIKSFEQKYDIIVKSNKERKEPRIKSVKFENNNANINNVITKNKENIEKDDEIVK